ncbi:MAG: electron transport complex subunit RsxE [Acidobacteriota bacterium]
MSPRQPAPPSTEFTKGLWRENPVLVQLLGLCPALAVTNSVANSLVMSAAVLFVLVGSSLLVSTIKRIVPSDVRISSYILIIATFVTMADMILEAYVPVVHKELGAFVALIVVNCIILGRQEAFASRNPVGRSLLDALGMSAGFAMTMLLMGTVREVLGSGTFLGVSVFGPRYEPWVVMILPPGGFLTLGVLLLLFSWYTRRGDARARAASSGGADVEEAA